MKTRDFIAANVSSLTLPTCRAHGKDHDGIFNIVCIHIAAEGEMQAYDRHAYLNVVGSPTMLLVQSPTCSHS